MHQLCTCLPRLPDLFSYGIVTAAALVKNECVQLFGNDFPFFIQHLFVGKNVYDLAQHAESIGGMPILDGLCEWGDKNRL